MDNLRDALWYICFDFSISRVQFQGVFFLHVALGLGFFFFSFFFLKTFGHVIYINM